MKKMCLWKKNDEEKCVIDVVDFCLVVGGTNKCIVSFLMISVYFYICIRRRRYIDNNIASYPKKNL